MSQQQATVERYKVNLGSLRSQIELKLHTYHALRVWQGGDPPVNPATQFQACSSISLSQT